jgi:YbgC/YbaW family acyl-CoA thioester hydrolase
MLFHTLRTAFFVTQGTFFSPRLASFLQPGVCRMYIGLRTADALMHANNARYLEFFEFARWHHLARTGMLRKSFQTGIYAVVGAVHIQYLRELKPLQMATVTTKVIGAHRRSLVLEQRLCTWDSRRGEEVVHAISVLKATYLRKGKTMEINDVLRALGEDVESFKRTCSWVLEDGSSVEGAQPAPPFASGYNEADDAWRALLKDERDRQRTPTTASSGGGSAEIAPKNV